uniref:Putative cysteine string protein n=1 Tax=Ixodes ricinus TaxID=34613 RepID=A0A0K8RD26_IXORI
MLKCPATDSFRITSFATVWLGRSSFPVFTFQPPPQWIIRAGSCPLPGIPCMKRWDFQRPRRQMTSSALIEDSKVADTECSIVLGPSPQRHGTESLPVDVQQAEGSAGVLQEP